MQKPETLPFLQSICWDLHNINLLNQDEILDRYERGWGYKGVLVDITFQEKQYILDLAKSKGSWLQIDI